MILDPFLEHRRQQEQQHQARIRGRSDPFASLVSVELNVMDACNRTCVFCPHADEAIYPNQPKWKMDIAITEKLVKDLKSVDYLGRFSFSGYGEPLLNKELDRHIATLRQGFDTNTIELNTNGDALTPELIAKLFAAGLSNVYVNLYDGPHQEDEFRRLMKAAGVAETRYRLRAHWQGPEQTWGLTLNNRSGVMTPLAEPLKGPCAYVAYKAFVDWNGNVLFCANDWGREHVVGNVLRQHFRDIWLSESMKEMRRNLFYGDRSHSPCSKCDVAGWLHGISSVDLLKKHYGWGDKQPPRGGG